MMARELMNENDQPTTIAYWVKLTLVALAIRLLAAFYRVPRRASRGRPVRLREASRQDHER